MFSDYSQYSRGWRREELSDFLLYRPLAYLVVKLTKRWPLRPDHFSFFALLSGVWAGVCFSHGSTAAWREGGLFLLCFNVFDCCDGMVARIKGNGHAYGEIVDMTVDVVVNLAMYAGLALGVYQVLGDRLGVVTIALCGMTTAMQAGFYLAAKKVQAEPLRFGRGMRALLAGGAERLSDQRLFLWGVCAGSTQLTALMLAMIFAQLQWLPYFALATMLWTAFLITWNGLQYWRLCVQVAR